MRQLAMVLRDAPCDSEKVWSALRLSTALLSACSKVRIFLYAESVTAANKGHVFFSH
jgi:sulfur relay (sulfurtransferase) complex TusBCD TusD component (DsrE family)